MPDYIFIYFGFCGRLDHFKCCPNAVATCGCPNTLICLVIVVEPVEIEQVTFSIGELTGSFKLPIFLQFGQCLPIYT